MGKISVEQLPLRDALTINSFVSNDERGNFVKIADAELFAEIGFEAKELFYSVNRKNSLRGLHYLNPGPQSRIVFCTAGRVYDVLVDLRKSSPTFKKWHAIELSAKDCRAVLIPRGFAHGFLSLEDNSTVVYLADGKHSQDSDMGIAYDDLQLGITWPLWGGKPTVSPRDRAFPPLSRAKLYD